jgi:hypothetical protein
MPKWRQTKATTVIEELPWEGRDRYINTLFLPSRMKESTEIAPRSKLERERGCLDGSTKDVGYADGSVKRGTTEAFPAVGAHLR